MILGWKPVDHWCVVLRRSATTWVSAIIGSALGAFAAHWGVAFAIVPFLPFPMQLPAAMVLGAFFVGGPIILARITEQPKLNRKIEEKRNDVLVQPE